MKNKLKLPQIDGVSVHCAHQKIEPVGKLKPYPRNNKTHPDAQIDLLCKAIKAQGWRAPVTVSIQSGYIVRGHARLEAAKRLGLKAVPVDYQNYASTETERLDRIADNKLAELAEWDMGNLKEELIELDAGDIDMDLSGFDETALEDLMTQSVPGSNLKSKTLQQLPYMAWCLIGVPLSMYDEISEHIETISLNDGVIMESTITNENKKNRQ